MSKLREEGEGVLAVWREIERSLAEVDPGSAEAERLQMDAAHLRDEYQRLMREAQAHDPPDSRQLDARTVG